MNSNPKTFVAAWAGAILACSVVSMTPTAAQSGTRTPRSTASSVAKQTPSRSGPTGSTGIAVVELFTSQSCNSCPPADAALRQVAEIASKRDLAVYVLSFHVDYWNRLGWSDPYSSDGFSKRQRQYASSVGSRRVYTPQMIVSGTTEFVGSNKAKAYAAINASLKEKPTNVVELTVDRSSAPANVTVSYMVTGDTSGQVLNIALVNSPPANKVPRGENAGRSLSHVNVVRAFETTSLRDATGKVKLELPSRMTTENARIIAYVQDETSLQITGAAAVRVES